MWRLTDLHELAGGEVGLVLAANTHDGEVVLKLSPRVRGQTDELAAEADALTLWAPTGAVPRLIQTRDDGLTLLMTRVRPGHALADECDHAVETVAVLGQLARSLHGVERTTESFCHLSRGALAEDWRRELAGSREADELETLLAPTAGDTLLHVDLHSKNALCDRGRWVAIDPKPHLGDPHAEVFGLLYGAPPRFIPAHPRRAREHARRLVEVYANAADLDADRIAAWTRLRALATGSVGTAGRARLGGRTAPHRFRARVTTRPAAMRPSMGPSTRGRCSLCVEGAADASARRQPLCR